jgi:tetratricopeptide (TPR) repeat protein
MNLLDSDFKIAVLDDFNLVSLWVASNPPHLRMTVFEPLIPDKPSTYRAYYLIKPDVDPDLSMAICNQAISNNPQNSYAYYNRAILKQEKFGDLDGALKDFGIAADLDPYLKLAWESRGSVADRVGTATELAKGELILFITGDQVTWVSYEKYHYILEMTHQMNLAKTNESAIESAQLNN